MKRKIYLVGLLVDDKINDKVAHGYVTRAIKHFHNDSDDQDSFHGASKPDRVAVIEIEADSALTNLREMVDFFKVMDRMQGKK